MRVSRTKKQIAGGQKRSLQALKTKIENMANEWEDVDEYNITILGELAAQCEQVSTSLYCDD